MLIASNHPAKNFDQLLVIPSASKVNWHAEKLTGFHTGTINISSGKVIIQQNKLISGSFLLNMRSISVTDIDGVDRQKLENNLPVIIFLMPLNILWRALIYYQLRIRVRQVICRLLLSTAI
jgi:hypothetical protein